MYSQGHKIKVNNYMWEAGLTEYKTKPASWGLAELGIILGNSINIKP